MDGEVLFAAIEQEATTAELEARHILEFAPATGDPLWTLAAFKFVIADALWRVARAVRAEVAA